MYIPFYVPLLYLVRSEIHLEIWSVNRDVTHITNLGLNHHHTLAQKLLYTA